MPFDDRLFFDSIVEGIQAGGVLGPLAVPVGSERPDWPAWTKRCHSAGSLGRVGFVEFIGDLLYDESTSRQRNMFWDFTVTSDDMRVKSWSIREAIESYLPADEFQRYLCFFVGRLDHDKHERALQQAFENILAQFNLFEAGVSASRSTIKKWLHSEPNLGRLVLNVAELRADATRQPALVLTLAIYQAAHISYLSELRAAFDRAKISIAERENAHFVIDHSLDQFNEFAIFATLLPLILLAYEELRAEGARVGHDEQDTESEMCAAISRGWRLFFETRLLRRDFPVKRGQGVARMICPANKHLRRAMDRGVLENIYTEVIRRNSTSQFRKLLHQVRLTSQDAVENSGLYYAFFRDKFAERNKGARGGMGIPPDVDVVVTPGSSQP